MKCIVHDQTDWSYEAGKKKGLFKCSNLFIQKISSLAPSQLKWQCTLNIFGFQKKKKKIFDDILKVKNTTILIARFYFRCSRKTYKHQQLELFLKCVGIIFVNCKKKHHQTYREKNPIKCCNLHQASRFFSGLTSFCLSVACKYVQNSLINTKKQRKVCQLSQNIFFQEIK